MSTWDVFISHASEDKEFIVEPIFLTLKRHGVRVWYDKSTLTLGDRLISKIENGIQNTKYVILVLSKDYFKKEWTLKELEILKKAREKKEIGLIVVWYNISNWDIEVSSDKKELIEYYKDIVPIYFNSDINQLETEILKEIVGESKLNDMITFENKTDENNLSNLPNENSIRNWFHHDDNELEIIWPTELYTYIEKINDFSKKLQSGKKVKNDIYQVDKYKLTNIEIQIIRSAKEDFDNIIDNTKKRIKSLKSFLLLYGADEKIAFHCIYNILCLVHNRLARICQKGEIEVYYDFPYYETRDIVSLYSNPNSSYIGSVKTNFYKPDMLNSLTIFAPIYEIQVLRKKEDQNDRYSPYFLERYLIPQIEYNLILGKITTPLKYSSCCGEQFKFTKFDEMSEDIDITALVKKISYMIYIHNPKIASLDLISKFLEEYITKTIRDFKQPSISPYDLDIKEFVSDLEKECKYYDPYSKEPEICNENRNVIGHIVKSVSEKNMPVILTGNYGMGKSTIAKYLLVQLIEKNIFPIFVDLKSKNLESMISKQLEYFTLDTISCIFELIKFDGDKEALLSCFLELFKQRNVVLIFDALDESVQSETNQSIKDFLKIIITSESPVYLSCREEFKPFMTEYKKALSSQGIYKKHLHIKLEEWQEKQWNAYQSNLLNKPEFYSKEFQVRELFDAIKNDNYGGIPRRPLFLKMLSRLKLQNDFPSIVENDDNYKLSDLLTTNRSEIYYKYLKWQLLTDIHKHEEVQKLENVILDTEMVEGLFELLTDIAINEYKQYLAGEKQRLIDISQINNLAKKYIKKYSFLTDDFIRTILTRTSVFAILRRAKNTFFTFSHQSFMEYLVAYRLSRSIFEGKPKCDKVWGLYQSYEVSEHFSYEVERVCVANWLKYNDTERDLKLKDILPIVEKSRNKSLVKAFKKTIVYTYKKLEIGLLSYNHLDTNSERFEEALFYIGRFKLKDDELLSSLEEIIKNREKYDVLYYRTASLSLSQAKESTYDCDKYVSLQLKEKRKGNTGVYDNNMKVQKQYYGYSEKVLKLTKGNIDKFIKSDKNERYVIANDILTYVSVRIAILDELLQGDKELNDLKKFLLEIRIKSEELSNKSLSEVCDNIEKVFFNKNKNNKKRKS